MHCSMYGWQCNISSTEPAAAGGSSALRHVMSQARPPPADCKPSIVFLPPKLDLRLSKPVVPSLDAVTEIPSRPFVSQNGLLDCLILVQDEIKPASTDLQQSNVETGRPIMENVSTIHGLAKANTHKHTDSTIHGLAKANTHKHTDSIKAQIISTTPAPNNLKSLQKTNGLKSPLKLYEDEENAAEKHFNVLNNEHLRSSSCEPLSIEDYIPMIRFCRTTKDTKGALQLYGNMCSMGLESHRDIGNYLITACVDCGLLSHATQVFHKIQSQSEHAWTALLTGNLQSGHAHYAFNVYQKMTEACIHPSSYTIVILLNWCADLKDMGNGQKVHTDVAEEGFEEDLFVGNALVDMYAKCGALKEAREVFDEMPDRDIVSWNALIAGYADHGPAYEAMACFGKLESEGLSADPTTLACGLKACASVDTIDDGMRLHTQITLKGFTKELILETALVDMYAKGGRLLEAQNVFNTLPFRDIVSWTALISGYADHQQGQETIECFDKMRADGILPGGVTYACVLKSCGNDERDLQKGQEIHNDVIQEGLDEDLLACNSLVGMYAKLGALDEAQEVFDTMPLRDVVSWNALITSYAEHGPHQQALHCFHQMQQEGYLPDSVTYVSILKSCGSLGALERGLGIHKDIVCKGFEGFLSIGNSLISMYGNGGLLSEAQDVFAKMPIRDVITWTAIMKGYAMNHEGKLAIDCFQDMEAQGIKADDVTLTCLLTACSHANMTEEGYMYLKDMREKYGISMTKEHYSCMVDILGRSGHLYEAERALEMLGASSDGTWAALLSACKTYGEIDLGLRCFRELLKLDRGNAAWYIIMKDIYSSASRWDEAMEIEKLRKKEGAVKKKASALIEVNREVHEFVIGESRSEELLEMLKTLNSRIKMEGGLVTNVDSVMKPLSDEEKETKLCAHAERLAIAFGILHTPQGQTLRLTKNLRMCNDCHSAGKIISRIEKREIVLRDDCCIHHFKDGLCLCKDMY